MVQIKSNVTRPDCKSFDYNQTTGAYSVTNTGGWGAPNAVLGDVATSILVIKNNKTAVIYDDIAVTAAETATDNYIFANLYLNATPTGIETIQDGIYSFTHTVTFNDESVITTVAYIASLCELNCAIQSFVDTMLDAQDDCCTSEKSDRMKAFSELMALYDILTKAFLCNNFTAFNSIYSSIELLLLTLNSCA
jgi:hypothetical protein